MNTDVEEGHGRVFIVVAEIKLNWVISIRQKVAYKTHVSNVSIQIFTEIKELDLTFIQIVEVDRSVIVFFF